MRDLEKKRARVRSLVVGDYWVRPPEGQPRELILLLHGFKQSGSHLSRKLAPHCPATSLVVAPDAPYPLPERKPEGGYRVGFSWYFYDASRDEYFIDMEVAIQYLTALVRELGAEGLPKRVVGFSQGGYLAPFAASRMARVSQVIGIASEFLGQELRDSGAPWPPAFRVDAIHGADDDIVGAGLARQAHEASCQQGARGEFRLLPGEGHRLTPGMAAVLAEVLRC